MRILGSGRGDIDDRRSTLHADRHGSRRTSQRIARRASAWAFNLQERLRTPWPYLQIGDHTYGRFHVAYWEGDPPNEVRIASYTSIARGVEFIIGGNHHPEWVSQYPFRISFSLPGAFADGQPASRGPITVGHDVWIGRNATVLSGVSIGDGAVIGAGAVVAKDIRPYAIAVGNPAREVRRRFDDDEVERLMQIRWWDWPDEEILGIVDILNSGRLEDLFTYAQRRVQSPARRGDT